MSEAYEKDSEERKMEILSETRIEKPGDKTTIEEAFQEMLDKKRRGILDVVER